MFGGNQPPEGWSIKDGSLDIDRRVIGYVQRHCHVRGHCYRRDCRRNVQVDFETLLKTGQGQLTMDQVRQTLRCSRLDGCAITWVEEPQIDPTLGDVAGRSHIAVEIRCVGPNCRGSEEHVTTVEAFIKRLDAAKTGGAKTPLRKIGEAVKSDCAACKGNYWRIRLLWFDPATYSNAMGRKQPLWKDDLDHRRQEAAFRKAAEPMPPGPPPANDQPKRRSA